MVVLAALNISGWRAPSPGSYVRDGRIHVFSGHARGLGSQEVVGGGVLGSVKGVHGCVGSLHLEQIGGDLKLLIFLPVISEKVPLVLLTLKMSTVKSGVLA